MNAAKAKEAAAAAETEIDVNLNWSASHADSGSKKSISGYSECISGQSFISRAVYKSSMRETAAAAVPDP